LNNRGIDCGEHSFEDGCDSVCDPEVSGVIRMDFVRHKRRFSQYSVERIRDEEAACLSCEVGVDVVVCVAEDSLEADEDDRRPFSL